MTDGENLILVFRVGEHRFGLLSSVVERVVRMVEITPLPQAPGPVHGVIEAGGVILPVLSIRRRFGMPERLGDPDDFLVLARMSKRRVALAAEEIIEVREAGEDWVERKDLGLSPEAVAGVVRAPDGLIVIQDLETFLLPVEEGQLDEALSNHG